MELYNIPAEIAQQLNPGNRRAFRASGHIDRHPVHCITLLPLGNGDFMIPLNNAIRKGTGRKSLGATLQLSLTLDAEPVAVYSAELMQCLDDEPEALRFFESLSWSNRNFFGKWIEEAKTAPTKANRIAQTIEALSRKQNFNQMVVARHERRRRDQ
ncbi:YdeI/OmpD-associated family protein [Chitinophaga sp. MD30]|uniref:YdeI/OmpD-associated family protein n=1 Tax=Chitinophaga sp. MD30 TaxID=2033437 RepID=UPI00350F6E71